jgi:hypothetical protein
MPALAFLLRFFCLLRVNQLYKSGLMLFGFKKTWLNLGSIIKIAGCEKIIKTAFFVVSCGIM